MSTSFEPVATDDADDVEIGGSLLSPDNDESGSSLVFEVLWSPSPSVDEALDDGSDVHPPSDADPAASADGNPGASIVDADEEDDDNDDVRSLLLLSSLLSSLPSLPLAVVSARDRDEARQRAATRSVAARIRRLPPLLTIARSLLSQESESRNSRMLLRSRHIALLPSGWGFASAAAACAVVSIALVLW